MHRYEAGPNHFSRGNCAIERYWEGDSSIASCSSQFCTLPWQYSYTAHKPRLLPSRNNTKTSDAPWKLSVQNFEVGVKRKKDQLFTACYPYLVWCRETDFSDLSDPSNHKTCVSYHMLGAGMGTLLGSYIIQTYTTMMFGMTLGGWSTYNTLLSQHQAVAIVAILSRKKSRASSLADWRSISLTMRKTGMQRMEEMVMTAPMNCAHWG